MGDITEFMTWFVQQVANIFTRVFNILDGITFANTSLLKVIITITILSALMPVLLTIPQTQGINAERREIQRRREEQRKQRKGKKNDTKSK